MTQHVRGQGKKGRSCRAEAVAKMQPRSWALRPNYSPAHSLHLLPVLRARSLRSAGERMKSEVGGEKLAHFVVSDKML